ncbi:glycoside hydrolase family protein [Rhizosphaericola mali]|uniref:hypothetical protein n=1 Tax=Rhizosphaericola mali TaxID=2545455 RepID=UPI0017851101|nr:hypothetical protein [Rhizosphaericola mali]
MQKAGNYAILGYSLDNVILQNMHIKQGWDGIHIRGGNNILIRNSTFETGDDAIAGGYWNNFVITDCKINSSCNGIRVIMPVDGVKIEHSSFEGPGVFTHRTSGAAHRTNMLAGIYIQPGGWGVTKGDINNVTINDLKMHNMDNALMLNLNRENNANNILITNIVADSIRGAFYIHSHNGGYFDHITLENIDVKFTPTTTPDGVWALSVNNVQHLRLKNINWECSRLDAKLAIQLKNVTFPTLENVKLLPKDNQINVENSGDIQSN